MKENESLRLKCQTKRQTTTANPVMPEREAMPPSEGTTSRGAGNQPLVMTSKVGAVMVTTIALLSEIVSQRDTTLTE